MSIDLKLKVQASKKIPKLTKNDVIAMLVEAYVPPMDNMVNVELNHPWNVLSSNGKLDVYVEKKNKKKRIRCQRYASYKFNFFFWYLILYAKYNLAGSTNPSRK